MSQQLINRSEDLQRLAKAGYAIRIESGLLVVDEIPYLDKDGRILRGVFACPLDATDDSTLPPSDHVMSFSGGMPHDRYGNPLASLGLTSPRCRMLGSLTFQHGFSNKLRGPNGPRAYESFYEKVVTYENLILGEVHAVDQSATARVGALPVSESEDDPFVFPDSASARAGTVDLTAIFKDEVVAFIGLGGTGSYILDHVAKTPVREARLIDGDRLYPFNTFRAPGAPIRSELQPPPYKVDYYATRYGSMKRNIIPHAVYLTPDRFHLLDGISFAFVSIDPCPEKALIIAELERRRVPFVDVGMGLHKGSNGIGGTLRAVLSTNENRDQVRAHIPIDPGGNDLIYQNNIQISDLNSLNANMAVQLWKGFRGFYADFGGPVWLYQVETRQFIREAA
ncbi:ThiF family adenylyltransferase [Roseibium sediminicola]|uniref:ThiF family adenylyltransferase n=1 Tax=Roseibium sediminicola TaxID=2933272 RepID=A0ABT0GZZ7_9HYPH|nr:ThiF family adenylyltransferase [Roseibium sp. CAU 1639]MCK7615007.1 ThiF family adenylyltransferase [Roseibium sp. CAU 1639]